MPRKPLPHLHPRQHACLHRTAVSLSPANLHGLNLSTCVSRQFRSKCGLRPFLASNPVSFETSPGWTLRQGIHPIF
jgi:hypothetical protein